MHFGFETANLESGVWNPETDFRQDLQDFRQEPFFWILDKSGFGHVYVHVHVFHHET